VIGSSGPLVASSTTAFIAGADGGIFLDTAQMNLFQLGAASAVACASRACSVHDQMSKARAFARSHAESDRGWIVSPVSFDDVTRAAPPKVSWLDGRPGMCQHAAP